MAKKPTYEELEKRIKELETEALESKRANEVLRASALSWNTTFDAITDSVCLIDVEGKILQCNKATANLLGKPINEIVGSTCWELVHGTSEPIKGCPIVRMRETRRPESLELPVGDRVLYVYTEPILDQDGNVAMAVHTITDITERKQADDKINHLNLVLRSIRKVNQLITKEKDQDRLLQSACDNLIENRGYYNAWIVLLDEAGKFVTATESGLGKNFLPMADRLKGGKLTDCGQRALRQSEVVVTKDPLSSCTDCPLSDQYSGRGAMTIHLEHEGKIYGLLSVSIPIYSLSDKEEQSLFQEISADIAFALNRIELEKERKQAQEALRESEEKYRSLTDDVLDSSAVGIFILDSDFRVVWVNQALEDYFGLKRNEIIGKDKRQLIRERIKDIFENPDSFADKVFTTYDDNTYIERFECHVLANGEREERWLEHRSQPIQSGLYAGGRIEHYYEITERKLTEEALRESEEMFKKLFEFAPDGFYLNDLEGNFIDGNKVAQEIIGYKKEELVGSSFLKLGLLPPEEIPKAAELLIENFNGRATGPDEFILNRKDGTPVVVEIMTLPVTIKNQQVVLGIARDISERKQAEEERKKLEAQLRQAQKMEAIGTLAGGIAHDFNNILGAIIGYTEIASLQVAEDNEAKESLKEVLKAGRRATDLVKQILAFSRKGELERIPVQINPIVKEALKLLRSTLPTTVEIRQNIESDTGIVEADPTQIHQILMNLCTNAAHAMREEGGVLEVGIRDVEIGSLDSELGHLDMTPGPYLLLTVSDTGEGMTPEILGRIFDPYFTTKEKDVGTGLGLAVVHGIVKIYGGTIWAYSEPGKGTTFHVYLPRIKEAKEMAEDESRPGVIPIGQERVLFIDDEPVLVDIGKQMLERLGYEVTTRTSSIEALELFRTKPDEFDLVITDMTMPKMTGDKLAKELMQIRPDIPIILCTGFSKRITEEKAKEIGIKAFVMKPIVIRDLANTVRKALD